MYALIFNHDWEDSGADAALRDFANFLQGRGFPLKIALEKPSDSHAYHFPVLQAPREAKGWEVFFQEEEIGLAFGAFGNLIPFAIAARRARIPSAWYCLHPSWLDESQKDIPLVGPLLTLFDHVAVPSRFMEKSLNPPEGVTTHPIPLAVEESFFQQPTLSELQIREQLRIPQDAFVLGYAAKPRRYKNHSWLISQLPDLPKNTHLLLCGREEPPSEFHQNNLSEERIHWVRPPRQLLPAYYRVMDLYVSPSAQESFGLSVMEALACGTPAIALQCPALGELSSGKWKSLLFDDLQSLGGKLREMLGRREILAELGKQLSAEVRTQYSTKKMESAYLALLDRLTAEGNHSQGEER